MTARAAGRSPTLATSSLATPALTESGRSGSPRSLKPSAIRRTSTNGRSRAAPTSTPGWSSTTMPPTTSRAWSRTTRLLDRDGARLDPAEFTQPLYQRGQPLALGRRRTLAQESDGRQLSRLLRARRERQRRSARRAGSWWSRWLHSITSSARASTRRRHVEAERFGGLEVEHRFVLGRSCTGRSAGFSPLRMRST